MLRERTNKWETAGAVVSFIGLAVTVTLQSFWGNMLTPAGFGTVGWGEILAAIGAIAVAISNIVSKAYLNRIPIGIFSIVKTVIGTIIFFWAAIFLFGWHHFMDAFSPFLWKWMLVYGTLIVVVGQSLWLAGLKKSSGSLASLVSGFNPIAAFLVAYLILGEAPTPAQLIGGGVILCGIVLSQIGNWRKPTPNNAIKVTHRQKMETGVGFKGI